ncbi:PREDICTED: cadherin-1-like [Nanorana parkeri]|uniref:cadherin-1-like n=1 Tax=Nanorana parkeri TaxID=125878 RepID=UPI0008540E0E|nr:PREDICTED: cadherin-1-like [Nanorana parkeri]
MAVSDHPLSQRPPHLRQELTLRFGMVFVTCGLKSNIRYESEDSHFEVEADGSVVVKDHLKLHGHKEFSVLALEGNNVLSETTVTLRKQHPHHKQAEHSHPSQSVRELRRQKRDWVIPPISCSENERGPFPKRLIQVKSSRATETTVYYSITGQGADSQPIGTFAMERNTGWLNVTRQLDRETIPTYKLLVYAVASNGQKVENPIDILIKVTDQNDNRPIFTQQVFDGTVVEGSKPGTPVMNVSATDLDDTEDTNNGIIAYSIVDQDPLLPNQMFTIDQVSGLISVLTSGLDRELYPVYTLTLKAIDQEGAGYEATGKAVITVTDANDNAPVFDPITYLEKVPENKEGYEVALLTVTDDDTPNTDAWTAVFKIVKGNEGNLFGITTTPDNMGQLKTVKALDFEAKRQHILLIVATNKANFSVPVITSTATVTVDVEDVNEPPMFVPPVKDVNIPEDLPSGQEVASYTAQDPDKAQNQKITYYIGNDPAGWLTVNPENGIITGNGQLDRESIFVKNNTYRAIILAVDNGSPATTGTGTLQIILGDVNDNGPYLEYQEVIYCQKSPDPLSINIIDRDLPPFQDPYKAQLTREARENWTASVVNTKFEIKANREMAEDVYQVPVTLADSQDKTNITVLKIQVCQCTAENNNCDTPKALAGGLGIPVILGILGGILALLILLLLLLLFVRKRKVVKEPLLPPEDETRDNVYFYDEEGGGEEDQDFDLGQLHRGLDARPDVIRNDVAPTFMPAPQYRPRPANPDEIGNFIDENLNAADNDPTAPPYDSLLVFDYEGSGSDAASLSSLNSSNSDADQDYSGLNDWGPRFRKLADMYGGDED